MSYLEGEALMGVGGRILLGGEYLLVKSGLFCGE